MYYFHQNLLLRSSNDTCKQFLSRSLFVVKLLKNSKFGRILTYVLFQPVIFINRLTYWCFYSAISSHMWWGTQNFSVITRLLRYAFQHYHPTSQLYNIRHQMHLFQIDILIIIVWCLLHVSNRRVHLQEDGCRYILVQYIILYNYITMYRAKK
jgi:hypothetical protein